MNNPDCSEDCFEDIFFLDSEYENDQLSFDNEQPTFLQSHDDLNQDSGGFFPKKHSNSDPPLQIAESVFYENVPNAPNHHFIPSSPPIKKKKPLERVSACPGGTNAQMAQIINLSCFYGHNCHKRKRVELDENSANFRTAFYNVCGKSVFPKEYVQKLHDAVCSSIGLPPISRTERRSIRTYFRNYAKYKNKIIKAVKEYLNGRQDLVNKICSPCKLKKSAKNSC